MAGDGASLAGDVLAAYGWILMDDRMLESLSSLQHSVIDKISIILDSF
jgi:hypothetical protein